MAAPLVLGTVAAVTLGLPGGPDPQASAQPAATWRLSLTPADATGGNGVDVYTAHLEEHRGQGFVAAGGQTLTFALVGEGAITDVAPGASLSSCVTPDNGTCTLHVTGTGPDSSTLFASVEGLEITAATEVQPLR